MKSAAKDKPHVTYDHKGRLITDPIKEKRFEKRRSLRLLPTDSGVFHSIGEDFALLESAKHVSLLERFYDSKLLNGLGNLYQETANLARESLAAQNQITSTQIEDAFSILPEYVYPAGSTIEIDNQAVLKDLLTGILLNGLVTETSAEDLEARVDPIIEAIDDAKLRENASSMKEIAFQRYRAIKKSAYQTKCIMKFFDRVMQGEHPYVVEKVFKNKAFDPEEFQKVMDMVEVVAHGRNLVEKIEAEFNMQPSTDLPFENVKVVEGEDARQLYSMMFENPVQGDFKIYSIGGICLAASVPDKCLPKGMYAATTGFRPMTDILDIEDSDIEERAYTPPIRLLSFAYVEERMSESEFRITLPHELRGHLVHKYSQYNEPIIDGKFATMNGLRAELVAEMASNTPRDRKSTRLNSSHTDISRMPSSA